MEHSHAGPLENADQSSCQTKEEAVFRPEESPDDEKIADQWSINFSNNHPSITNATSLRLRRLSQINKNSLAERPSAWISFFYRDKDAPENDDDPAVNTGLPRRMFCRYNNHRLTMQEADEKSATHVLSLALEKILCIDLVRALSPLSSSTSNFVSVDSSSSSLDSTLSAREAESSENLRYPVLFEGRLEHIFTVRTATGNIYCGVPPKAGLGDKTNALEFALAVRKHIGHCRSILCSCGVHQNPHYIKEFYELDENQMMGYGEFGRVIIAKRRNDDRKVVIKIINAVKNLVKAHARTPKGVDHPCVVRFLDFYFTPEKVYCVMDHVQQNLLQTLLAQESKCFDERRAKFVVQQVLAGLSYLHSMSIVHGNIKPENILVVDDHAFPQIQLTDFGYLRIIKERCFQKAVIAGSSEYIPPEGFTTDPRFDKTYDMWSVGVLTYVCLTGTFPYNPQLGNITEQIRDPNVLFPTEVWSNFTEEAQLFIGHLLNEAIWFRMRSCHQALRHNWISQDYVSWCDMRALEVRVGTASESGTVLRYGTLEEDDFRWEKLLTTRKLPKWEDIGCNLSAKLPRCRKNSTVLLFESDDDE